MKVAPDVLAVLDRCSTVGPRLYLPESLDRPLYVRTNKVLEAAGGKWNRSAHAHVFEGGAADAIEQVLLTGQITTHQETGYFPTPPAVAARLLDLANLEPGMLVLEPSAGTGELVRALFARGCVVDAVEFDIHRAAHIRMYAEARRVTVDDFLRFEPAHLTPLPYDRVVMNPPFARQADIDHVLHALNFLRPGGRLVSVMSNGVTFRRGKAAEFRLLVAERGGSIEPLPSGSFLPSTGVETVVVAIPTQAAT
jgi:predicted RNA methylase